MLFLEGDAPKEKELKIVTSFVLTRSEVRSGVDAKKPSRFPKRTGCDWRTTCNPTSM